MTSHRRHARPPARHVHTFVVGAGFAGLVRGDQARGGRRARLPGRRARAQRRRRHLARQHLPRRRVRRALASSTRSPSRPTPTGRAPSPRSRRSRPTSSASPSSPACWTGSGSTPRSRTPRWDEARPASGTSRTTAGSLTADVAGHRRRRRSPSPKLPDIDGIDSFAGEVFHSARVGPRLRPHRQAGRGHRHRRLGDPDRAGDRRAGRPPRRLPAHRAVGHPAPRPGLHRAREARVPARAGRAEGLPDGDLLGPRELRARRSSGNPRIAAPAKKAALMNIDKGITDPELREKVTPTSRSAASGS